MHLRNLSLLIAGFGLIMTVLACAALENIVIPTPQAIGPCANILFPTAAGTTWNYDLYGNTTTTFTRSILSADETGFTGQDVFPEDKTIHAWKWKCTHGNLLGPSIDDSPAAPGATGWPFDPSMKVATLENTGTTLPFEVHVGDGWTQTTRLEGSRIENGKSVTTSLEVTRTCTAARSETITVPAGTFDGVRIDCQIEQTIVVTPGGATRPTQFSYSTTDWYAPDVGLVKSVATGAGIDSTLLLNSYH